MVKVLISPQNYPMPGKLRAFLRLAVFSLVLAFFITRLIIEGVFKGFTLELGLDHRQRFCRAAMKVLNIKVTNKGAIHHGNYLFISNHRCYMDPIIQLTQIVALPVAKAEVASWPLIGYGAKITGIHFVKRESLKSRKAARNGISETIQSGNAILIYPEGTTLDTPTSGNFKPGTFNMAAENKIEIVPIAIEYQDPTDAWVGAATFFPHYLKMFSKKKVIVEVHYGDPVWMEDGPALVDHVKTWIDGELLDIRKKWGLPV